MTIEEGEGEIDLEASNGGRSRKKPRKQNFGWDLHGNREKSTYSAKETPKEKEDLIAELHGITIPQVCRLRSLAFSKDGLRLFAL